MADLDERWVPEYEVEHEIVIRRSRFIARLVPVRSVDEAEAALARIRAQHQTATHNCYAYRVGLSIPVERFSDDGEPGGTAGRPILEVLRRYPLHQSLVVVTRYFGGILLGAGGLVHAYTEATTAAIRAATLLACRRMQPLTVRCDYSQYGKLEYELERRGALVQDRTFGVDVAILCWTAAEQANHLASWIREWSGGQVRVETGPPQYVGVSSDGRVVPHIDVA